MFPNLVTKTRRHSSQPIRTRNRHKNQAQLCVEQLEDRTVPSTLTGSTFQIDGDRVDGGNDWATLNPDGDCPLVPAVLGYACQSDFTKTDNPGSDDALGKGSSEDDVDIHLVTGSIPPQKADLGPPPIGSPAVADTATYGPGFEFYTETIGGNIFLYLNWTRNNSNGTVNYDFEINQAVTDFSTADPKTGALHLNRTGDANQDGTDGGPLADDLLIIFDIAKGGNEVNLAYRKWTGTEWSDPIALDQSVAIAAVSSDTLFGEAGINLTAAGILLTNPNDPAFKCEAFSQAWVHSRSSDSFSSEIKDIIKPTLVSLTNCGLISGYKFNDLNGNGAWDKDGVDAELPLGEWTINLDGPVSGSQVTKADGYYEFSEATGFHLIAGTYNLTETAQAPWQQTTPNPVAIVLTGGGTSDNNNFGNRLPELAISFSGHKFLDVNGDGLRQVNGADEQAGTSDDEIGLNGWQINLSGDSIQPATTATVGGDVGFYSFAVEITFGQTLHMTVAEVLQTGWAQTAPGGSYAVTISWTNPEGVPTFDALTGKQFALDFGNRQGSIFWEKRDGSNDNVLLRGATFTVSPDPTDGDGSLTVADDADGTTDPGDVDQDPNAGQFLIINVPVGATYTIAETVAIPGYSLSSPADVTVPASGDIDVDAGDFVNYLGSIRWEKRDGGTNGSGNTLLGGATFTVSPNRNGGAGTLLTVADNTGQQGYVGEDADPAPGLFWVKFLPVNTTYTIAESVAPAGYTLDPKTVAVTIPLTGSAGDFDKVIGTTGEDPADFHDYLPRLEVVKTPNEADDGTYQPGETATFKIVVCNTGFGTAFNVTLDDVLPDYANPMTPTVHVLTWYISDSAGDPIAIPPGASMTPNTTDSFFGTGDYLHVNIGDMFGNTSFTIYVSAVIPADYLGSGGSGGSGLGLGGLFELEGDTVDAPPGAPVPPNDWSTFAYSAAQRNFTSNADAEDAEFVSDGTGFSIFTGGGSKDNNDLAAWRGKDGSVPPKDDILNAYSAAYLDTNGDFIIYFGQDRATTNGDAQVGTWFFQNPVTFDKATGTFRDATTGLLAEHKQHDILILSNFTNGGTVGTVQVFEWDTAYADNLHELTTTTAFAMAVTNLNPIDTPWRSGIPKNGFFEGGINLTELFKLNQEEVPCLHFSSFLQESRSSQSVDAVLKDFVVGKVEFDSCVLVPLPNVAYADAGNPQQAQVSDAGFVQVTNDPDVLLASLLAPLTATSSADPFSTPLFAPRTSPISNPASTGQGELHSVSTRVFDLVFSDFENHERSELEGDDLSSGLHDLLYGLAKGRRRS